MKILVLFSILSFLLDGLLSTIIPFNSIFLFKTYFSIVSLVLIYPYFLHNKKYYIIALVMGILFDLVYTNTIFLNIFTFLTTSYLISIIYNLLQNKIINGIVITIITLFFYNTLTYLMLFMYKTTSLNYGFFLSNFIFIVLINVLYFVILYFALKKITNKKFLLY